MQVDAERNRTHGKSILRRNQLQSSRRNTAAEAAPETTTADSMAARTIKQIVRRIQSGHAAEQGQTHKHSFPREFRSQKRHARALRYAARQKGTVITPTTNASTSAEVANAAVAKPLPFSRATEEKNRSRDRQTQAADSKKNRCQASRSTVAKSDLR